MIGERDVIALLHRADWTRLCLAGEVRGGYEPTFSTLSWSDSRRADAEEGLPDPDADERAPDPEGDEGPREPDVEQRWTLLLAPGKRYREELPGQRQVRGSDGERIWQWGAAERSGPRIRLIGGPQPPFPALLAPSWLLDRYELTIGGDTTACGRAAIRVEAAPRPTLPDSPGARGLAFGIVPVSPRRWALSSRYDHVSAIVDAELGILLSCERRRGDDSPDLAEFVSLTIDPDTDPAAFTAPPGSITSAPTGEEPFSWEVAKAAAGLAAGGLGAVVRYSPFGRRRVDPFAHATSEDDPEPEMPLDDPLPGPVVAAAAPVSDEVLHLLYRAGEGVPALTGLMHEWLDGAGLLSAIPETARRTGFGGVGFLVDALAESSRSAGTSVTHDVRSVRVGGWDKYRIDRVFPVPESDGPGEGSDGRPGWRPRKRRELRTVACDGEQRWQVYTDRVFHGPAGPPQDELVDLLDGSWLLACDLSGEEEITVGGRRAYRFTATDAHALPLAFGMLAKITFPAVAVVDAETGLVLRVTTFKGGKPVARHELRDVEPADGGDDFGFDVPAGMTVVEESEEKEPSHRDWGQRVTTVDAAKAAARGWFDSFRAGKPPRC